MSKWKVLSGLLLVAAVLALVWGCTSMAKDAEANATDGGGEYEDKIAPTPIGVGPTGGTVVVGRALSLDVSYEDSSGTQQQRSAIAEDTKLHSQLAGGVIDEFHVVITGGHQCKAKWLKITTGYSSQSTEVTIKRHEKSGDPDKFEWDVVTPFGNGTPATCEPTMGQSNSCSGDGVPSWLFGELRGISAKLVGSEPNCAAGGEPYGNDIKSFFFSTYQ